MVKHRSDHRIHDVGAFLVSSTDILLSFSFIFTINRRSPTYCASLSQAARDKSFQCLHSQTFGLIVHGLWPQAAKGSAVRAHPRNCRDEPQLNATFVKRFFCMMPDEELMQAEWEKHGKKKNFVNRSIDRSLSLQGTCYYERENEYYLATEQLYQSLRFPSTNIMESSNAGIIKDALLALNAPSLIASAVKIDMTNANRLKEVKICYDLNFRYTSCS